MPRRRTRNRKWDAPLVISAIRSRKDIHYNVVRREDESLLKAAKKFYGTWEDAVIAAGLEYPPKEDKNP